MADFEVNTNGVLNCANAFDQYSKSLSAIAEESSSILSQLRGSISARVSGAASRIAIYGSAKACQADMNSLGKAARQATQIYLRYENNTANKSFTKTKSNVKDVKEQLKDLLNSFGKAIRKKSKEVKNKVIKKVTNYVENAKKGLKKVGEKIKEGYEYSKGKVVYAIDVIKESYNNKGKVYRAVQYGKAIVKAAGGVSKIFVGVASILGSGGLSTLASGFSIASGINDIINVGSDLKNLHAGNYDDIGKVNFLKEKLSDAGGAVGGLLGNEELGKKIGKAAYYGMEAYTAYANFSNAVDKVKQLDKTNLKELGEDIKAIGNLKIDVGKVLTTDIQQLKYEIALGKMYFKSATGFVSNVSALNSAVSTGAKVIKKGNEVINSFSDSDNAIKKFFDAYDAKVEYKSYTGFDKTCNKIKVEGGKIVDILTLMVRQAKSN